MMWITRDKPFSGILNGLAGSESSSSSELFDSVVTDRGRVMPIETFSGSIRVTLSLKSVACRNFTSIFFYYKFTFLWSN